MNYIDIILGAFLLLGLIRGLIKGFFIELAGVISLIAGVYGAINFSFLIEEPLYNIVSWDDKYIELSAFALTFIIIVVGISLLAKFLTKLSKAVALGPLNRIFGGIFGLLKTAAFLSIILLFFSILNNNKTFVSQKNIQESMLYTPVKTLVPTILPSVLKEARELDLLKERKPNEDSSVLDNSL